MVHKSFYCCICVIGFSFYMHKGFSEKSKTQKQGVALDIQFHVEKYQLANGMRVLLHPDPHIPQVYHQLWVNVGSKDEVEGKTGLAHLFEHMMFRGTDKHPGKLYDARQESLGASNNAFTSFDYTAYYVTLPSQHLDTILEMEARRLSHLQITQSHFEQETEVVKEERRQRTDNDPNDFFEPMMKLLFPSHPYGRPIIGFMKDLDKATLKDLNQFFKKHYSPHNIVLVLAGDFEVSYAKKRIQKHYGALKSSFSVEKKIPFSKKKQNQARSVRLKRKIEAPTLAVAYRGPPAGQPGAYALTVLNHILAAGESSRLHKLLVHDKKWALSVGGGYYDLKEAGVFVLEVLLTPKASLKEVKNLVYQEVEKTRTRLITQKELLKSTRHLMYDYVTGIKSIAGKANALGEKEILFKDFNQLFKDIQYYKGVRAEDVKKQALSFLSPQLSSVVELVPF